MTETDVCSLYREMLGAATNCLRQLPVFCGRNPAFSGLSGWVFEQTAQKCIRKSLAERGVELEFEEQVSLGGRAKADLRVGTAVIEMKTAGLFDQGSITKYSKHQSAARAMGLRFVFLSRGESYKPYRDGITSALGADSVFFLDEPGSWERLIGVILDTAVGTCT